MAAMPDLSDSDHRYHFGEFTLDTRRGDLSKNGDTIKIRAQSFQVLHLLLQRHGSLVTKTELHDTIWRNKVVSDDSLTHCLLDIRKAIEDGEKTIIRTVPRRGYLFEGACNKERIADESALLTRKSLPLKLALIGVAAVGLLVIAVLFLKTVTPPPPSVLERSIAVLPFIDRSATQDQAYLGNGLSDEILNLLARSPDLNVIARTSSFSFNQESPDIDAIRDLLRVGYVLDGSLRREADALTVNAQLIATESNEIVWSRSFDGQPKDIMRFQRQIADSVLATIAPDAEEFVFVAQQRNFTAEELMYLAQFYEQQVRDRPEVDYRKLDEAIELYRDATKADPRSAIAHSRLAGALLYAGDVSAATEPLLRAEALNPHLSEVQETLGEYYWLRGEMGAGKAWLRAIELNTNNADALSNYAYWYWMQANDDGPEEWFRRALSLDPLSLARHAALGDFLGHQARVDKTLEMISRIEGRFDSAESDRVISRLYELIGKLDHSIAWGIKARDRDSGNADHIGALAELYAEIGDIETALNLEPDPSIGLLYKLGRYEELIDKAEIQIIEEPADASLRYLLAFSYGAVGDNTNALRALRSVGQPSWGRGETRQPIQVEGFIAYMDALNASGSTDEAIELAAWFESKPHTESANWWIHLHRACSLAILGRDDDALQRLEQVAKSPRLPWNAKLTGSGCFNRLRNTPRYQAVLTAVDERRSELRDQLSATLQSYDVSL